MRTLHPNDKTLLLKLSEIERELSYSELSKMVGISIDAVMRSCAILESEGLVSVRKDETVSYALTDEGRRFLKEKFPEQRVLERAERNPSIAALSDEERAIGVPWALKNEWIEIRARTIYIKKRPEKYDLYDTLIAIAQNKAVRREIADVLVQRGSAVAKITKSFFANITPKGKELASRLAKEAIAEIGTYTREVLLSKEWRERPFRKYDVIAPVERPASGQLHPLREFIERVRDIFLSLGFEEISGPEIESAFWNFDALFTPQDHPARELQDTFYLSKPPYLTYPKDVGEKVRAQHESVWKYTWDPDIAERAVLRTHTTPVSARALVEIQRGLRPPGKYFCIGRTYRNEAIDATHLAEFHQIEGIVAWPRTNFRHLLGLLKTFYAQLGFKEIRFVPHYFPYTEPSVEVQARLRGVWIELGGAGIFRPELCGPLCGFHPVLAWGLSVERPLMIEMGIDDIRTFYRNDLLWLRTART